MVGLVHRSPQHHTMAACVSARDHPGDPVWRRTVVAVITARAGATNLAALQRSLAAGASSFDVASALLGGGCDLTAHRPLAMIGRTRSSAAVGGLAVAECRSNRNPLNAGRAVVVSGADQTGWWQ
jgi:hypothetical protein